ncbi:MAG: hypothetical protein KJZ91_28790 [Myxococcales bacterium]|nr:hypothetical protein [Myxococcales bacterium]
MRPRSSPARPTVRALAPLAARAALAALALAACGGDDDTTPDAAPTGTAPVRVVRYGHELDVETRAAAVDHALEAQAAGNCVALPSRAANLDLGSVRLSVGLDGGADDGVGTTATWDGATLTACMPAGTGFGPGPLRLRASIPLQPYETWGASQVGYSFTSDGSGQPMFYLVSWVEGCDRFGPCDTSPDTFAHYRFTIHHRSGMRALCPGRVTAGDTTTVCEFDHGGGPTYSTYGFIASPSWQLMPLGDWGGVTVTLHDRPGSGIAPLVDADYHRGFLAWMVSRFGPYPYGDELRIVTGPTYWSGFEHPGNIVLDDGLDRPMSSLYLRPVAHVLNHELAHQWAGDQTTLASTYDFVWKEAMAEYLTFVYEDLTNPVEALATARAWKSFARGAAYFPVPEDEPRPTLLQYYGEVYGPGPMILFRQLETLTSREQVLTAIASVLGRERALSVAEVQAALELTTGLDLDRYFDTWVRGSGAPTWPTFRVEVTGTPPSQSLVVTEVTPGGGLHGCDFAVGISDGAESAKVMIRRGVDGAAVTTVATGVSWAVTTTTLDPDAQCLAYLAAPGAAPVPRHPPGWTPWRGSLAR